ncbi:MAG TPA: response regulator transcription factor [Ruminiclostridium sp.]|nr:response regulator transcription factor [Ruminiclostridium sp.]
MRLLLIEDDIRLSEALKLILEDNSYSVDTANDGNTGLETAQTGIHDMIILDRMLPGIDGIEILKTLRREGLSTPVLLLTAKDTVEDRVVGLDAGADDYLVKPFATKELLARIRALSRRPQNQTFSDSKLSAGLITLDTLRCEVICPSETVKLTLKETQLLELFIRKKGLVINKDQILDKIWGLESPVEMNNIEIYIHYLRKKLNRETCGIQIETIRGTGYCLVEDVNV